MKTTHWKLLTLTLLTVPLVVWAVTELGPRNRGSTQVQPERRQSKSTPDVHARALVGTGKPRRSLPLTRPFVFSKSEDSPPDELEATPARDKQRLAEKIGRVKAEEKTFIDAFDRETVDTIWSGRWTPAIEEQLQARLGDTGVLRASEVECRQSKCLVTMVWNDYATATGHLGDAAQLTMGLCASRVAMPPPEDPDRPYKSRVQLDNCRFPEET